MVCLYSINYVYVGGCACAHGSKRVLDPWELELGKVVGHSTWVLELNSGSVQEHQVLLIVDSSLQPLQLQILNGC